MEINDKVDYYQNTFYAIMIYLTFQKKYVSIIYNLWKDFQIDSNNKIKTRNLPYK